MSVYIQFDSDGNVRVVTIGFTPTPHTGGKKGDFKLQFIITRHSTIHRTSGVYNLVNCL